MAGTFFINTYRRTPVIPFTHSHYYTCSLAHFKSVLQFSESIDKFHISLTAANTPIRVSSANTLFDYRVSSSRPLISMADFTIEDTQNSAPGQPSVHEASKLSSTARRQDTQSVTKRYGNGIP